MAAETSPSAFYDQELLDIYSPESQITENPKFLSQESNYFNDNFWSLTTPREITKAKRFGAPDSYFLPVKPPAGFPNPKFIPGTDVEVCSEGFPWKGIVVAIRYNPSTNCWMYHCRFPCLDRREWKTDHKETCLRIPVESAGTPDCEDGQGRTRRRLTVEQKEYESLRKIATNLYYTALVGGEEYSIIFNEPTARKMMLYSSNGESFCCEYDLISIKPHESQPSLHSPEEIPDFFGDLTNVPVNHPLSFSTSVSEDLSRSATPVQRMSMVSEGSSPGSTGQYKEKPLITAKKSNKPPIETNTEKSGGTRKRKQKASDGDSVVFPAVVRSETADEVSGKLSNITRKLVDLDEHTTFLKQAYQQNEINTANKLDIHLREVKTLLNSHLESVQKLFQWDQKSDIGEPPLKRHHVLDNEQQQKRVTFREATAGAGTSQVHNVTLLDDFFSDQAGSEILNTDRTPTVDSFSDSTMNEISYIEANATWPLLADEKENYELDESTTRILTSLKECEKGSNSTAIYEASWDKDRGCFSAATLSRLTGDAVVDNYSFLSAAGVVLSAKVGRLVGLGRAYDLLVFHDKSDELSIWDGCLRQLLTIDSVGEADVEMHRSGPLLYFSQQSLDESRIFTRLLNVREPASTAVGGLAFSLLRERLVREDPLLLLLTLEASKVKSAARPTSRELVYRNPLIFAEILREIVRQVNDRQSKQRAKSAERLKQLALTFSTGKEIRNTTDFLADSLIDSPQPSVEIFAAKSSTPASSQANVASTSLNQPGIDIVPLESGAEFQTSKYKPISTHNNLHDVPHNMATYTPFRKPDSRMNSRLLGGIGRGNLVPPRLGGIGRGVRVLNFYN